MEVGNAFPVRGIGGATAGRWTEAGVELAFTGTSASTGPLDVGTYLLHAPSGACRVRQGASGVAAVATDSYLNIFEPQTMRVSGAADNYVAAIGHAGGSGTLHIMRLDP
jgi:hypothetical protein